MRVLPFILIAFVLIGCHSTPNLTTLGNAKVGLVIPLKWENPGTIDPKVRFTATVKGPLSIVLLDKRENPMVVGHCNDKKCDIGSTSDLVKTYSSPIAKLFNQAGAQLARDKAAATIEITITSLFVTEANLYNAQVIGSIRILKDEASIWTGTWAGTSKRWGKSFSASNYNEALTNGLVDFVDKLSEDSAFIDALAKAF